MKKIHQAREKRSRNAAYAESFPPRDRSARRKARRGRVVARERAWAAAHGVRRERGVPWA